MTATLEIACFSPEDAVVAARAGADRIELCQNYGVGGLTPSLDDLDFVMQRVDLPVFVMIREHSRGFVYKEDELARMKVATREVVKAGADGIVFGALLKDGRVDESALHGMVEAASPKPLTFHRAFDEVADPHRSLDALVRCGVTRVLTSGGKSTATEGAHLLARLIERASDDLIVIPGGGVRSHNVEALVRQTSATEVHSAARTSEGRLDSNEVKRLVNALA